MNWLKEIRDSLAHLLFPHICAGCGIDVISKESMLCARCIVELPETDFHIHLNNPVEKKFWGRLPLESATAQYYFDKGTLIQHLMHQLKYRGNKELGKQLGGFIGQALTKSDRFKNVDALIPLPLFPGREKKRGYNQATVLCEGIAGIMNIEILKNVVIRNYNTSSQTKKGRIGRWQNMEGRFELINADQIKGKHLLLIDDVITTGATLEACGLELLKPGDVRLSIATLCCA